jgi:hypothetical protein
MTISHMQSADQGDSTCVVNSGCGSVTTARASLGNPCPADFNQSGGLSVQDIFDSLNAWFSGDPRADFSRVNGITVQDIFDFLNAWFGGC